MFENGDVGLGVCSGDIVVEEVDYRVEVGDRAAGHNLDGEVSWPSNGDIASGLG